jgi:hypothetical protein
LGTANTKLRTGWSRFPETIRLLENRLLVGSAEKEYRDHIGDNGLAGLCTFHGAMLMPLHVWRESPGQVDDYVAATNGRKTAVK